MLTISDIRKRVKKDQPLIHCITNPISINQCANAVLAVGARPVMAEHPLEAAEITANAKAVLLNLGNITDSRLEAIRNSAEEAKKKTIPVVLDAVGVACSTMRKRFAKDLIELYTPAVIKGNYSEIKALFNDTYCADGVDAEGGLGEKEISRCAVFLAKKHNSVILASGKSDIVTDGRKTLYINCGTPQLGSVTGTGCMLGALCACYLSVCGGVDAAVTACTFLGICGELSETEKGSGSFMVKLMDNLSTIDDEKLEKSIKVREEKCDEV